MIRNYDESDTSQESMHQLENLINLYGATSKGSPNQRFKLSDDSDI